MAIRQRYSYRRVLGGSFSNVAFFAVQTLAFLVLTPATLQALGTDIYGLWTILLAVLGFSNVAQFGTDFAVSKYTAQYSTGDYEQYEFSAVITFSYVFVLATGVATGLIIWLLRFWIALRLETAPTIAMQLPSMFGLVALGIIPGFLFSVSRGILLGLLHNTAVNSIDVSTNVLSWLGALVIGLRGGNLVMLAWLVIFVNLLRLVWGTVLVARATTDRNVRFILDAHISGSVLRYSSISWVTSLGWLLSQSVDRLLVGMILGPTVAGMYGIAASLAARLIGLISKATQTLMPYSSAQSESGSRLRLIPILRFSNRFVGCMSLLMSGILIIWMDEILRLWIAPDFASAYAAFFRAIVAIYGVSSLALPAQQVAQGLGWITVPAAIYLSCGILMNAFIVVLSPTWALTGVVVANLVLISLPLITLYLVRRLSLPWSTVISDLGVPLLAFAIAMSAFYVTDVLAWRVFNTVALAGAMLWLAFGRERFRVLVRAIRA